MADEDSTEMPKTPYVEVCTVKASSLSANAATTTAALSAPPQALRISSALGPLSGYRGIGCNSGYRM